MVRYPAMVRTAKTTPARGASRASRLPLMMVPPFRVADPSEARRRAGRRRRLAGRSLRSADRLILGRPWIGRGDDDRRARAFYLQVVHKLLVRLRGLRLDPLK